MKESAFMLATPGRPELRISSSSSSEQLISMAEYIKMRARRISTKLPFRAHCSRGGLARRAGDKKWLDMIQGHACAQESRWDLKMQAGAAPTAGIPKHLRLDGPFNSEGSFYPQAQFISWVAFECPCKGSPVTTPRLRANLEPLS